MLFLGCLNLLHARKRNHGTQEKLFPGLCGGTRLGKFANSHSKKTIWPNHIRFAHPPADVACAAAISGDAANTGFVTLCMDHEKGRCARDPCRCCRVTERALFDLLGTKNMLLLLIWR